MQKRCYCNEMRWSRRDVDNLWRMCMTVDGACGAARGRVLLGAGCARWWCGVVLCGAVRSGAGRCLRCCVLDACCVVRAVWGVVMCCAIWDRVVLLERGKGGCGACCECYAMWRDTGRCCARPLCCSGRGGTVRVVSATRCGAERCGVTRCGISMLGAPVVDGAIWGCRFGDVQQWARVLALASGQTMAC